MRSELFRDVPDALVEWRSAGIKTYIYSSGSREAQRLFFGYSQVGGGEILGGSARREVEAWLRGPCRPADSGMGV